VTDLDAIRARDAEFTIGGGEIPYLPGATRTQDWASAVNRAVIDRRALLAEVDRLSRKPDVLRELDLLGRATRAEAELAAERARIAAEVRGLPVPAWDDLDLYVDRAAVLAIVEGD